MPSLIPGYEYDIFISYRQKDNKYDGWVSEFVDNLKKELEATFKEDISLYFDINPHNGLLETHDVDASLKEKLRCLIFIPIISRTYCDPKSFAWEHEFKAFVEFASKDQLGLKVKLPNGNVASRVLPVRIHDLDNDDIKLCESVLGGVLRGIEFIYKEPGVNKPLTPDDDEKKNLNRTKFRIQVNRIANAVKEIISGLKTEPAEPGKDKNQHKVPLEEFKKEEKKEVLEKPAKLYRRKLMVSGITLLILLVIAGTLAYPKLFKKDTLERLRSSGEKISVAVMPFQNMTNDTTWNVWQDGIQNELINSLTNSEELKIRQIESVTGLLQNKGLTNYASITPAIASTISQKLDADVFIYGSIKHVGVTTRVNAQLFDTKTEEIFKSFQIDGIAENILDIIDSLSIQIKNFLVISVLQKEASLSVDLIRFEYAGSPEAYRYFIYAGKDFMKNNYPAAIKLFQQALDIDSNLYYATAFMALAYGNRGLNEQAKKATMEFVAKRDMLPARQKIMADWLYSIYYETPFKEIEYINQILEIDDQQPNWLYELGRAYNETHQYDNAIRELERALEIYKKWESKPMWNHSYTALAYAYHKTGQYRKEKKLYKKAENDFPDDPAIIGRKAIMTLSKGDTDGASRYIEKYISLRKERSASESVIDINLASIYSQANVLDKAEEYYRKALSLEPENPNRLNNLAWFLIEKDRNINEGLELVEKSLALSPEDYTMYDTKGWGLYKQGKFREALVLIEKAWNLKPRYDHEVYLHLEAARKAVAGMK